MGIIKKSALTVNEQSFLRRARGSIYDQFVLHPFLLTVLFFLASRLDLTYHCYWLKKPTLEQINCVGLEILGTTILSGLGSFLESLQLVSYAGRVACNLCYSSFPWDIKKWRWQTLGRIETSLWVRSVLIILSTWREGEIERLIKLVKSVLKRTTQTIPIEVNRALEVIFLMIRRHEISGWRLTIYARSCTVGCMLRGMECPYKA